MTANKAFVSGSVIAAIVVHITTLNASFAANDSTYEPWIATIASQVAICMSNVTACSPQFKPFLESLRSSGMRLDTLTTKTSPQTGNGTSVSHIGSKGISFALRSITGRGKRNESMPYVRTVVTANPNATPDWDGSSQTSQSRIIRETRTWTVVEERREDCRHAHFAMPEESA